MKTNEISFEEKESQELENSYAIGDFIGTPKYREIWDAAEAAVIADADYDMDFDGWKEVGCDGDFISLYVLGDEANYKTTCDYTNACILAKDWADLQNHFEERMRELFDYEIIELTVNHLVKLAEEAFPEGMMPKPDSFLGRMIQRPDVQRLLTSFSAYLKLDTKIWEPADGMGKK